jgi:hypothetical protein
MGGRLAMAWVGLNFRRGAGAAAEGEGALFAAGAVAVRCGGRLVRRRGRGIRRSQARFSAAFCGAFCRSSMASRATTPFRTCSTHLIRKLSRRPSSPGRRRDRWPRPRSWGSAPGRERDRTSAAASYPDRAARRRLQGRPASRIASRAVRPWPHRDPPPLDHQRHRLAAPAPPGLARSPQHRHDRD